MKASSVLPWRWALLALALIWGFPCLVPAEPARTLTPGDQLRFGERLLKQGDFPQAATEFERFLFFFPDHPDADEVRYRMGQARFRNQEVEKALDIFKSLAEKNPDTDLGLRSCFDLSACYFLLRDPFNAVAVLEKVAARSKDPDLADKAWFQAGWIGVETGQWDEARTRFNRISRQNKAGFPVGELARALKEAEHLPVKNPSLSGVLSLVPGGGYLYCERPKDALMAFLLNTGLIWAAAEAFHNHSPALGTVLTLGEIGFYAGNIYGGINSAHKYNEKQKRDFIGSLEKNTEMGLEEGTDAFRIAIRFQKSF